MRFVKMQGIGNDYVYVNTFKEKIDDPTALARRISDRHFGIGSDGLILVGAPTPNVDADVRMRMFNADGSESEMCGNGVRCVCKFAYDHNLALGVRLHNPIRIQTGRGILLLHYRLDDWGKVGSVTVDMQTPILDAHSIPVTIPGHPAESQVVNVPIPANLFGSAAGDAWTKEAGLEPGITCVSMGNPHAILFCKDVSKIPLEQVGSPAEHHAIFPRRINVHFVQVVSNDEVIMRTWERGAGITLACGTGACAVAVAGVLTQRTNRQILAHLPGGDLQLEWNESDNHLYMTGPAVEVFQGEWHEADLNRKVTGEGQKVIPVATSSEPLA